MSTTSPSNFTTGGFPSFDLAFAPSSVASPVGEDPRERLPVEAREVVLLPVARLHHDAQRVAIVVSSLLLLLLLLLPLRPPAAASPMISRSSSSTNGSGADVSVAARLSSSIASRFRRSVSLASASRVPPLARPAFDAGGGGGARSSLVIVAAAEAAADVPAATSAREPMDVRLRFDGEISKVSSRSSPPPPNAPPAGAGVLVPPRPTTRPASGRLNTSASSLSLELSPSLEDDILDARGEVPLRSLDVPTGQGA